MASMKAIWFECAVLKKISKNWNSKGKSSGRGCKFIFTIIRQRTTKRRQNDIKMLQTFQQKSYQRWKAIFFLLFLCETLKTKQQQVKKKKLNFMFFGWFYMMMKISHLIIFHVMISFLVGWGVFRNVLNLRDQLLVI